MDSFTNGYNIPYCQVWIGSRSGAPTLIGDSLQKLGIFSDDITARKYFTSVEVRMEARKPNEASITLADPYGLMDQGIHAGVPCYIKMGYASKPGSMAITPWAKLMFVGVLQRETTNFNSDGTIELQIPCRDNTDKLRYEKKTREFKNLTKMAIVQKILSEYMTTVFGGFATDFKEGYDIVKSIKQVNQTDLEFIYKLAGDWGATFDVRTISSTNSLMGFFVDDSADGDKFIGNMQPDKEEGVIYKMDWRKGLKNVQSLKFSGEASSRGEQGGIIKRKEDGKMEEITSDIGSNDPHDPSNWELDQSKVDAWLKAHPKSNMDDFNRLAFAMPIPEMHEMFFKKKTTLRFGATKSADSQDASGLGAGGFKCDFELVRGDPFLVPNLPVELGGDVYRRYKSEEVSIVKEVKKNKKSQWVETKSGVLYWRVSSVTHTFNESGLHTKGVIKR